VEQYGADGYFAESRQVAYRGLLRYELNIGLVDEIRRATNSNYALGNDAFTMQISEALGRRVTPGQSGRPKKQKMKLTDISTEKPWSVPYSLLNYNFLTMEITG
jgi:hypothetical protein